MGAEILLHSPQCRFSRCGGGAILQEMPQFSDNRTDITVPQLLAQSFKPLLGRASGNGMTISFSDLPEVLSGMVESQNTNGELGKTLFK